MLKSDGPGYVAVIFKSKVVKSEGSFSEGSSGFRERVYDEKVGMDK